MKKTIVLSLVSLLLVVGIASMAQATMIAVNNPFITQSWDQQFRVYGSNSLFDKVEVYSTGQLATPGIRSFSDQSWTDTPISIDYHVAQGNATGDLSFNIHFEGDMSNVEHFILATWSGDNCIEADEASWDGGGWNISGYTGNVCDFGHSTQVPEPSTLLLLGTGLIMFVIFRKRIKGQD